MKGIGFNFQDTDQEGHITKMKFVSPEEATKFKKVDFQMSNPMPQHLVQRVNAQFRKAKNESSRYHYCGKYGHIRSYCFKLHGYPQTLTHSRVLRRSPQGKREWKIKATISSLVVQTTCDTSFR